MTTTPNKVNAYGVANIDFQKKGDAATLAYLLKTMPLDVVCSHIAVALADRNDLRALYMKPLQRKINDLVWPLVDAEDT